MFLPHLRAGWSGDAPPAFDTFDLIAAVTAEEDGSNTFATINSNALTWDEGDLLLAFASGNHGNTTRNGVIPSPNSWTPGSESWTKHFDDRGIVGTQAASFNCYTTTALSDETAKTAALGFSGTMFALLVALMRVPRSTIIRQVSPVAKVESTGTSITATFGAAVLETSQIVSFVSQRNGTTNFGVPTNFTEVLAQNIGTAHRAVVAARIGHAGTTVETTGMSSGDNAKLAVAIELARAGQEL